MPKTLVFGHRNPDTDAIGAAIAMARLEQTTGADTEAVALGAPNPETRFALDRFGIPAPRVIERAAPEAAEVILVDHNERQQSVSDLAEVTIRKVIDHHRVANFETLEPLYFRAEPVGCTCTILTNMYDERSVPIPPDTAGIMLSAIISDTLLLHSPTTTELDRSAATRLAATAGVDLDAYGRELLRAGTDFGGKSAAELVGLDAKDYTMRSTSVRVGQLNTVDPDTLLGRRDELLDAMHVRAESDGVDLFLLFLTDVLAVDSQLLVVGKPIDAVERALGVTVHDGLAAAPGIVSRKKQVVPQLTRELR